MDVFGAVRERANLWGKTLSLIVNSLIMSNRKMNFIMNKIEKTIKKRERVMRKKIFTQIKVVHKVQGPLEKGL